MNHAATHFLSDINMWQTESNEMHDCDTIIAQIEICDQISITIIIISCISPIHMQLIPKILKRTAGNMIDLHTHVSEFTLQLQHVSTQVMCLYGQSTYTHGCRGVSIYDRNVARHAATGLYPGELER